MFSMRQRQRVFICFDLLLCVPIVWGACIHAKSTSVPMLYTFAGKKRKEKKNHSNRATMWSKFESTVRNNPWRCHVFACVVRDMHTIIIIIIIKTRCHRIKIGKCENTSIWWFLIHVLPRIRQCVGLSAHVWVCTTFLGKKSSSDRHNSVMRWCSYDGIGCMRVRKMGLWRIWSALFWKRIQNYWGRKYWLVCLFLYLFLAYTLLRTVALSVAFVACIFLPLLTSTNNFSSPI